MIINVEIKDFIRISFFKYHYNLHNFYTKFHNIENSFTIIYYFDSNI